MSATDGSVQKHPTIWSSVHSTNASINNLKSFAFNICDDDVDDGKDSFSKNRNAFLLPIFQISACLFFFVIFYFLDNASHSHFKPFDEISVFKTKFLLFEEAHRWSLMCALVMLLLIAVYWMLVLIIYCARYVIEKKFGQTTMLEIFFLEYHRMKGILHYTFISINFYIITNLMFRVQTIAIDKNAFLGANSWDFIDSLRKYISREQYYPSAVKEIACDNAFLAAFLFLERIFLRKVSLNFNMKHFWDRIEENNFVIKVLEALKVQLRRLRRERLKASKKAKTNSTGMTVKKLADLATPVPSNPNEICLDSNLQNPKNLANGIFNVVSSFRERDTISADDFVGLIPEEDAEDMFLLLHRKFPNTIEVNRNQFTEFVSIAFEDKKNLMHSISTQVSIIEQLHICFIVFILIIWALFCVPEIVFILSPPAIALNKVISDYLEDLVDSMIFVFIKHPFDIGDAIVISGIKYKVISIDFSTSTLLGPEHETIYCSNSQLHRLDISNLRRAGPQTEDISLAIATNTPQRKIDSFERMIKCFIRKNKRDFLDNCKISNYEIVNCELMTVSLSVQYVCNFSNGSLYKERRNKLLLKVHEFLDLLGIKNASPTVKKPESSTKSV